MAEGGEKTDKEKANEYKKTGNKFMEQNMNQEAVEEYTLGISLDSTNHVLYSNRAAAHAKLENYAESLNDAEQVVKLRPDWPKGYSRKGSALQFLGRFEEAKAAFERGLELDADNEMMKKALKECEAELEGPSVSQPLGNPFANLETIMPRLREDERTRDHVNEEDYMVMLKDLGEDPLNLSKYLTDDRLRLTLSALLGFDLEKPEDMNFDEPPFAEETNQPVTNDPEPKIDEPQQKIEELPEIAQMSLNDKEKAQKEKKLGTQFLKQNDFANAHQHYDNAIAYDPTDISFYSNKALAYMKANDALKCREMSEKVVEVGKKHGGDKKVMAKAYMRIGQTYMDEGDYEKALDNFTKSMAENETEEIVKKIQICRENISRQAGS
uniref:stress-induced-phosphoprotein 1-like n=1 Tax=Styela clava TaxID=7725 RepID=UPI00193997EF|nr:stress-induced-phosphoprotein 1-like [Styela clava]